MKKLFLIDALLLALVVLAGLMWSVHDQSEYADRLDHYGLSETTMRVKTTSTQTLAQAAAALTKAGVVDAQVQFQTTGKTPRVYLWAKGNYATLPMTSGSWFSDADLASSLPTAVVGQALTDSLRVGSNQRYLNLDGQYIPVLGVVASRQAPKLDHVTFINAAAQTSMPIKSLLILADGPQIDQQVASLKRALKATSVSDYTFTTGTQKRNWWVQNRAIVLGGAGLMLVVVVLAYLAAHLAPLAAAADLDHLLQTAFVRGWWGAAIAQAALMSVIGVGISWWGFYYTSKLPPVVFVIGLFAVYAASGYLFLQHRNLRERGK